MSKTCKNDIRSLSSYQLSKEASNNVEPPVGIPNSVTAPNLATTPTDTEKTVNDPTNISAGTLDLLKRQLNTQETENRIALYQIHRLMRQLKLEAAARLEGQVCLDL